MKLRNSLINMFREFIGLHKTPDYKLNAQSSQAILEAVAAETRRYLVSMNYQSSENIVNFFIYQIKKKRLERISNFVRKFRYVDLARMSYCIGHSRQDFPTHHYRF